MSQKKSGGKRRKISVNSEEVKVQTESSDVEIPFEMNDKNFADDVFALADEAEKITNDITVLASEAAEVSKAFLNEIEGRADSDFDTDLDEEPASAPVDDVRAFVEAALGGTDEDEISEDSVEADGVADADALEAGGDDEVGAESEDTELGAFESADIEQVDEIPEAELDGAIEALLYAADRPQSVSVLKSAFQGTKVKAADIRAAIERLQLEYSNPRRGVNIVEVAGGYQIRTKPDHQKYLLRTVKARPFRLSGPALEVLSIVAYKQPCTKSMVDEIRGVESGHLMRGLLDRGLLSFGEKSELPGRPMFYETTKKFLEIFGLRNLNELPTLNEIDQLIPEGIGEVAEEKETLSDLTGKLSTEAGKTYSEGEEELQNIASELSAINTSSEFFEDEKRRQKEKRERERAQDIRDRITVGEQVDDKDRRWLERYDLAQSVANVNASVSVESAEAVPQSTDASVPEAPTVESAEAAPDGPAPETL